MPRPRKRRPVPPSQVLAVLEGDAVADLAQLLDLVRRVNPSRLGLQGDLLEERYVLKARLQSLVLRRYADEITIAPTRHAGVVGIRRRGQRGDACHAVVARLDADARALVAAALASRQK